MQVIWQCWPDDRKIDSDDNSLWVDPGESITQFLLFFVFFSGEERTVCFLTGHTSFGKTFEALLKFM